MISVPWSQVPPGARVVLSSGRIVHVIAIVPTPAGVLARLRDDLGRTRDVTMTYDMAPALVLTEPQDIAVQVLAQSFPDLEFLRSVYV